jgi:hypothetical protein
MNGWFQSLEVPRGISGNHSGLSAFVGGSVHVPDVHLGRPQPGVGRVHRSPGGERP